MGSFFRVPASSASSAGAAFLSAHHPAGGRITERFIAPMVEPGGMHRSVARVGHNVPGLARPRANSALTLRAMNSDEAHELTPDLSREKDSPEAFRAYILGSTSSDWVRIHPDLETLPDAKSNAKHSFHEMGGGGTNAAIALKALSAIYEQPCEIRLCTKIGQVNDMTATRLEECLSGIEAFDMADIEQFKLPENIIISFQGGRFISTGFKAVEGGVSVETTQEMIRMLDRCDYVLLNSRYPKEALVIAQAAEQRGITTILDYSYSDPTKPSQHHYAIPYVDYVLCAEEAILPGMDKEDPEVLKDKMLNEMGAKNLAISGGSKPIYTCFGGIETYLPVEKAEQVVDTLGTGDLRNAGFTLFLAKGEPPLAALEKASKISTLSVQYPGRSWLPVLAEQVRSEIEGPHIN